MNCHGRLAMLPMMKCRFREGMFSSYFCTTTARAITRQRLGGLLAKTPLGLGPDSIDIRMR